MAGRVFHYSRQLLTEYPFAEHLALIEKLSDKGFMALIVHCSSCGAICGALLVLLGSSLCRMYFEWQNRFQLVVCLPVERESKE